MGKIWYLFLYACVFHMFLLSIMQLSVKCLKGRGWRFSGFFNPHRPPLKSVYPKQGQFTGQWTVKIWLLFSFSGGPYCTACGMLVPSCSSVTKSCLTLCDSMDCSMPGFPVLHHLPEFAQIHVHWIDDAIQPSHPPLPPSPPALSLSQHQGLFSSWSQRHGD